MLYFGLQERTWVCVALSISVRIPVDMLVWPNEYKPYAGSSLTVWQMQVGVLRNDQRSDGLTLWGLEDDRVALRRGRRVWPVENRAIHTEFGANPVCRRK